jgi:chromate transporter
MSAVSSGLIAATGLKLIPALRSNPMGHFVCGVFIAATFMAVAWLRVPLAWVLVGLGLLACAWAWHRIETRKA